MAPITLPAEFGYVGLVVAATFFMNFWHMMRIGSLRKKYKIEYPAMTSDKHQDFMYAQRVHQNNLEQLPFFNHCWHSPAFFAAAAVEKPRE